MDKGKVVKQVIRVISSVAVSTVVSTVIKANTPADLTTINKVLIVVGSAIIGGMVSDKGADYVMKTIDEVSKPPVVAA